MPGESRDYRTINNGGLENDGRSRRGGQLQDMDIDVYPQSGRYTVRQVSGGCRRFAAAKILKTNIDR